MGFSVRADFRGPYKALAGFSNRDIRTLKGIKKDSWPDDAARFENAYNFFHVNQPAMLRGHAFTDDNIVYLRNLLSTTGNKTLLMKLRPQVFDQKAVMTRRATTDVVSNVHADFPRLSVLAILTAIYFFVLDPIVRAKAKDYALHKAFAPTTEAGVIEDAASGMGLAAWLSAHFVLNTLMSMLCALRTQNAIDRELDPERFTVTQKAAEDDGEGVSLIHGVVPDTSVLRIIRSVSAKNYVLDFVSLYLPDLLSGAGISVASAMMHASLPAIDDYLRNTADDDEPDEAVDAEVKAITGQVRVAFIAVSYLLWTQQLRLFKGAQLGPNPLTKAPFETLDPMANWRDRGRLALAWANWFDKLPRDALGTLFTRRADDGEPRIAEVSYEQDAGVAAQNVAST